MWFHLSVYSSTRIILFWLLTKALKLILLSSMVYLSSYSSLSKHAWWSLGLFFKKKILTFCQLIIITSPSFLANKQYFHTAATETTCWLSFNLTLPPHQAHSFPNCYIHHCILYLRDINFFLPHYHPGPGHHHTQWNS